MSGTNAFLPRSRVEGLTDLVFGLALSISAIALVSKVPADNAQFVASVGYFAFSFLILINIWTRYTSVVSLVPIETSRMMRLNITLLFFVALEPYLFNLLLPTSGAYAGLGQDVSTAFALDIGSMNMILAYFVHVLTREEKGLVPKEMVADYRFRRNLLIVIAAIFVVSVVPQLWAWTAAGEPDRVWLWLATFPLSWSKNLIARKRQGRS